MQQFSKKIIIYLSLFVFLFSAFSIMSFAENPEETAKSFVNNDNKVICVAHRGDWHSFPENSVEAINAAKNFDAVSVDLKVTSDSHIVLMADETVDRMCTDSQGKAVSGKISSLTYEQLSSFYLREGNGSSVKNRTDSKIPQFCDIYNSFGNDTLLILNVELNDFDAVYKEVKKLNAQKKVVFRINGKTKEIISKAHSVNFDGIFLGNYQGNIIFNATKAVKDCFNANINTVELGSKNGHGILYDSFLMKRFNGKYRAFVSMVNGRCGKRTDNETGWDDLISRGYSVIETDYPDELTEYISQVEKSKLSLSNYYDLYSDTDLTPYTTETEKAFSDALHTAQKELSEISSLSELDNARNSLQSSHDSLTVGQKKAVTLSFRPTVGRVITVILCLTAFIVSQVYLFKKRRKKDVS
ncbi:MAG: glycerophosphodiester phosphodiesterase family protein [Ruminococcus sp.]|nr:glycerophosphodiester phosphodiesterase family protein [Candidatus Copronaster equi]